jgi:hypothetical protein
MFSIPWYIFLLQFVAGLFLANGVPHFVQGISGAWFQTPFFLSTGRRRILACGQRVVGIS